MAKPQSTYICRVQSCIGHLPKYWPTNPSPPSECVLPPHQRQGDTYTYTLAGQWEGGGGGSIFWKMPDIGLASLRAKLSRLEDSTEFLSVSQDKFCVCFLVAAPLLGCIFLQNLAFPSFPRSSKFCTGLLVAHFPKQVPLLSLHPGAQTRAGIYKESMGARHRGREEE